MLRIKYFFLFLLISKIFFGQNCQWAKNGNGFSESHSVCTDNNGNIFVSGLFASSTITFGTFTLTNSGSGVNLYLVKYDPSGNVIWAKSGKGDGSNSWDYSVFTDLGGNIYTTGFSNGTSMVFDSYTLTVNSGDLYLVKYDPNGNVLWAKREGGIDGLEASFSVKGDLAGNIYIAGYSTSTLMTVASYTLTNPTSVNNQVGMFLIKYDSNGNVLWAQNAKGFAQGYGGTVDGEGNAYVTGAFGNPTMSIGAFTLTQNNPNYGFFLAKFDGSGNVLWAKTENCGYGYGLVTNNNNDVFVTGSISGSIASIGTHTIYNNDVFLAKYDKSGNVIWAKGFGSGTDYGYSVATDISSVYTTGRFNSPLVFGTYTLAVPPGYVNPAYITRFDFNGNLVWSTALDVGSSFPNHQSWICTDAFSNLYLTGFFQTNPFNTGCSTLTPTGARSGFVLKYHFNDVGIEENNINTEISTSIFPNPNDGNYVLRINRIAFSGFEKQRVEIVILDIAGKELVKEDRILSANDELKMSNSLLNGAYMVRVKFEDGSLNFHRLLISK